MRLASVVSRLNYRRETKILEVLILKRFKVQTADGHTLLLYYPTQEKAQESCPDATITEHTDQSHVEYIERMLAAANDCKTAERKGSTVYLLRFNTSAGICLAMLFRDISDGMWYDLCQYQFWKSGALVAPSFVNSFFSRSRNTKCFVLAASSQSRKKSEALGNSLLSLLRECASASYS